MRIISKFNDYYDSVQAYGQDEKCVYMRESKEFKLRDATTREDLDNLFKAVPETMDALSGKRYILGFCGKLYSVWEMNHSPKDRRSDPFGTPASFIDFAYRPEDVEQFCGKHKELEGTLKIFSGKLKSKVYYWKGKKFRRQSMSEGIAEVHSSNKLDKLFWDYKVPCFVIPCERLTFSGTHTYTLHTNPCLKDYKFFKVKDTVSAYQDIGQYISGILGLNDPEIVHISDEDMKKQKGFGHKYAFKKEPGGRK